MKDRQPTPGLEGRVKITKEDGTSFYAVLEMADSPLEEGTPLAKQTLLTDQTAALFGLDEDAVPNNVFAVLSRFHAGLGNDHIWRKSDSSGVVGYVNAVSADAYPPSEDDGYTYEYLGQLGNKIRIESGSYTGIGGVNYHNLVFTAIPDIVIIGSNPANGNQGAFAIGFPKQAIGANNAWSSVMTGIYSNSSSPGAQREYISVSGDTTVVVGGVGGCLDRAMTYDYYGIFL